MLAFRDSQFPRGPLRWCSFAWPARAPRDHTHQTIAEESFSIRLQQSALSFVLKDECITKDHRAFKENQPERENGNSYRGLLQNKPVGRWLNDIKDTPFLSGGSSSVLGLLCLPPEERHLSIPEIGEKERKASWSPKETPNGCCAWV